MKIMIIEDEKAAVRNLVALIEEVIPNYQIVGTADSIVESINWFRNNNLPDIVFMDIHLADGSAFEIFEHIKIDCPIIFTTAYDEYALRAFRVNSVDYLLKPIGKKDIEKAINKLNLLYKNNQEYIEKMINTIRTKDKYRTHFLIPTKGSKLIPLSVESVYYFFIDDGLVKVFTKNNEKYILSFTLDELVDMLNPADFFRINRQYLIARDAIKDIDLWFNSRLSINLKVEVKEKLLVSKVRVTAFKEWFAGTI